MKIVRIAPNRMTLEKASQDRVAKIISQNKRFHLPQRDNKFSMEKMHKLTYIFLRKTAKACHILQQLIRDL